MSSVAAPQKASTRELGYTEYYLKEFEAESSLHRNAPEHDHSPASQPSEHWTEPLSLTLTTKRITP